MLINGIPYEQTWLYRIAPTDNPIDQEIVWNCSRSARYMAQALLHESYDRPMDEFDEKYWNTIDDDSMPYGAICTTRGRGKSTGLQVKGTQAILFRMHEYIIPVGHSLSYAVEASENIKNIILTNPFIQRVFRLTKPQSYEGINPSFGKTTWCMCDPDTGLPFVVVRPLGYAQNPRGGNVIMNGRNVRPSLFLIDDADDPENLGNDEVRERDQKKFFAGLLPARDTNLNPDPKTGRWDLSKPTTRRYWRFIAADSYKVNGLVAKLITSSRWNGITLPLAYVKDGEYYSYSPSIMTDEQVRETAKGYEEDGRLDDFFQEYMCMAQAPGEHNYSPEMFQYYSETQEQVAKKKNCKRFIIVDPARVITAKSCFTNILAAAASASERKIFLCDNVSRRMRPEEIAEESINLAERTSSEDLFVEDAGLHLNIEYIFVQALRARNSRLRLHFLKAQSVARGNYKSIKEARGATMLPDYRARRVWHEKKLKDSVVESQLVAWPNGTFKDAIDCVGHIPQCLRLLQFAFDPVVKTVRAYEGEKTERVARRPLRPEDAARRQRILSGDWRTGSTIHGYN